jgi:hypothetical protein
MSIKTSKKWFFDSFMFIDFFFASSFLGKQFSTNDKTMDCIGNFIYYYYLVFSLFQTYQQYIKFSFVHLSLLTGFRFTRRRKLFRKTGVRLNRFHSLVILSTLFIKYIHVSQLLNKYDHKGRRSDNENMEQKDEN